MWSELKDRGNAALAAGRAQEAVDLYTLGLQLQPSSHVLYSNRSAARCRARQLAEALADADECVRLAPDWPKAYSRRGAALELLGRRQEALAAYEAGLRVAPGNQQLLAAVSAARGKPQQEIFFNPFGADDVVEQIRRSPRLRRHLDDADFRLQLRMLRRDPALLGDLIGDRRVRECVDELLGSSLQAAVSGCGWANGGGGGGAAPEAASAECRLPGDKETQLGHRDAGDSATSARDD